MKRQHTIDQKEARPEEVSAGQVVAHLATLTDAASIRAIAHGMGLKHRGRRFLPRVIQQLKRRGEVEEIYGGRYRLAGQKQTQRGASSGSPAAAARSVEASS